MESVESKYAHGKKGMLSWSSNGVSYSEEVIYAGMNKNATGPQKKNEPGIWIVNRHGKCMPLPITLAKQFFAKPGKKYDFAKLEDIPFIPEEKVYPHDPGKSPEAQMKATTTKTGKEVEEAVKKGKLDEVVDVDYTWNEVRALAKENGITSYKRSKADIVEELQSKNLI